MGEDNITTPVPGTFMTITALGIAHMSLDDFSADGVLATVGLGAGARGMFVAGEIDVLWEKATDRFWVSLAEVVGLSPITLFRTRRSAGLTWSIGLVFDMTNPQQFRGGGAVAAWPIGFLGLTSKALADKGKAWSLVMHLAKSQKRRKGFSALIGISSSGPSFFQFGPYYASLTSAATWNTRFVPLDSVIERYPQLEGVESLIAQVRSLGDTSTQIADNGDKFADILAAANGGL